jgi:hypothetical protein
VLGWVFREQPTSDFGVDAHVELVGDGAPTGRLLGVQVKSGPSHFSEPYKDGWIFRPSSRHMAYWLNHSLPMTLLLVDVDNETIYWQELCERTFEQGPRGGILVKIPSHQGLPSAREPWARAADKFASTASADYTDNLERLCPTTVRAVQRLSEKHAEESALLAAHLARGRGVPELVVQTLLTSSPPWLKVDPAQGYEIVADFARSHALGSLAADALLLAAEADPSGAYRRTRNAGLVLLDVDREHAGELLDAAAALSDGAPDPRLDIGRAVVNHPLDSAHPVVLSPELEGLLRSITDDDFVVSFLSRLEELRGNVNAAVHFADEALRLSPDSAGLMAVLAGMLARRSPLPESQPSDLSRAIDLASAAVDQLHRWAGPTEDPRRVLLQAQMTSGAFAKVLDRALPPPDGQATPEEAALPEVRSAAAVAARALGRTELADALIDALPEGVDKELAMLRNQPPAENIEEDRQAWLAVLDKLDESRPEAFLQTIVRLADLGVDQSFRLNEMVEKGWIAESMRSVAKASAAASANLDAGLPNLRVLADSSHFAAVKLVDLLVRADRIEDAEVAADSALSRFGNVEFAVQRAGFLVHLNRLPEAEATANDALTHSDLDLISRRTMHRLLAHIAAIKAQEAESGLAAQLWRQAENHMVECVNPGSGLEAEDPDVWQLAEFQLRMSEPNRAYETLSRNDPKINNEGEARLWFHLSMSQSELPMRSYARMLDLADEFADEPKFSGALLTAVVARTRDAGDEPASPADQRPEISEDLRAKAFAALNDHVARHGEDSPVKLIQGATPEELVKKMTDLMRRDDAPLIELVDMIRQVRVPIGTLATSIGRPYSSVLAQRGLGYFIASTALDRDDLADEVAAKAARNGDVVVDASTLLIASELGEFERFRGIFRSLLVPSDSSDDLVRGRVDVDGRSASSGWVTYDSSTDSIAASELNVDEQLATLRRFTSMEQAAAHIQNVPNVSLEGLNGVTTPGAEPWLSPIALAKTRGVPLWSDDVALRTLARALGVEAFGTTTLQQIRTAERLDEEGIADEEVGTILGERRTEVLRALESRVVDVAAGPDVVVEQARSEGWNPSLAMATIGRRGWWHLTPDPWIDLHDVLAALRADGGDVDAWQTGAMLGASELAVGDPSRVALLLACVALVSPSEFFDIGHAIDLLQIASDIGRRKGAHEPADYLLEAAAELARFGLLNEPQRVVADIRARLAEPASGEEPPGGAQSEPT